MHLGYFCSFSIRKCQGMDSVRRCQMLVSQAVITVLYSFTHLFTLSYWLTYTNIDFCRNFPLELGRWLKPSYGVTFVYEKGSSCSKLQLGFLAGDAQAYFLTTEISRLVTFYVSFSIYLESNANWFTLKGNSTNFSKVLHN